MTIANIKISQLQDIGANLDYQSTFPVDDNNASPVTTKKGNLQIIGNYILSQAGGSNFVQAAQATLAQSVVNAAQPNITSVGTLTSLDVSGNLTVPVYNLKVSGGVNGYVLKTDGTGNLSWTAQSGNGGGNGTGISNGATSVSIPAADGNVVVDVNGAVWEFGTDGTLTFPDNASGWPIREQRYGMGNLVVWNDGGWAIGEYNGTSLGTEGIRIDPAIEGPTGVVVPGATLSITQPVELYNISGGGIQFYTGNASTWTLDSAGTLTAPGNADFNGNVVTIGPGASNLSANLANPTLVISDTGSAYIQAAINNVSDIGSADWAAYGHHGNDAGGWVDMGFTSSFFSDPNYTITGPGDGYLITQAYPLGQAPAIGGGNLVLATGVEGTTKDIIFGTGGFAAENEFGRISDANNALELTRTASDINFVGGGNIVGAVNISAETVVANTSIEISGTGGDITGANSIYCNTVVFSDSSQQSTAYAASKSGFNVQYPLVTMGNFKASIDNSGNPTVGAVTSNFNCNYTLNITQYDGSLWNNTANGAINSTFNTAFSSGIGVTFAYAGDMVVGTFMDTDSGSIYKVTWIATPTGPGSGYGSIILEKLI